METARESWSSADEPVLIARTPLAARQWEAWLLEQTPGAAGRASRSLPLVSYAHWIRTLWSRGEDSLLLGRGQSLAAWRRVVEDSRDEYPLLSGDAAAAWALDAERRLQRFDIDAGRLRAGSEQPDFAAFLRWRRAYHRRLGEAGWVDLGGAEQSLAAQSFAEAGRLCLLDLHDSPPLQQGLFAALSRSGWRIGSRAPPEATNRSVSVRLRDTEQELLAAADWACRRHGAARSSRIALVVDDLPSRSRDVSRAFATASKTGAAGLRVWCEYESPIDAHPLIGAALSGIELLGPQGTFAQFSRWLRSPFFQGLDPAALGAAANIETQVRSTLLAQLSFDEAYHRAGLALRLRRDAPALAARLEAALDEVGALRQTRTPTDWAGRWQRGLRRLGWPATTGGGDEAVMRAWDNALENFTRLTPVLGLLPLGAAVAELRRILQSTRPQRPLPRAGVHVFADVDAVGPGYDSVWVTGLTDRNWPGPPRLNPLLPRDLQVSHAMPGATPQDALRRSRAALARLQARVGHLVISWPDQLREQGAEPSPLIRDLRQQSAAELGLADGAAPDSAVFDPARIESRKDAPPALTTTRIPGGAGTLNKQARCPLRAFCESRLDARPLEPPSRGLAPRAQGVVAHRALQLLAARQRGPAAASGGDASTLDERVVASVEQALVETFGAARRSFPRLLDLERRRFAALIRELLDKETARGSFEIVAAEARIDVSVAQWTIPCRLDRIDRLDDGTLAVIDYKTGMPSAVRDWFRDRLLDTQLPIYALHEPDAVRALVVVTLQRGAIAYKGTWSGPDQFPGRATRFPAHRDWPAQLTVWRRQIEQLIAEYAAGDTRLFVADLDLAKGAYAPLSRVYEYSAEGQHGIDR